jgi:DNA modification methylase
MIGCGRKIGSYDCCAVVCGDCLNLIGQLQGNSVDLIVTDPPYGIGVDYGPKVIDTFENWKLLIDQVLPMLVFVSKGAVFIPTSKIEGEAYLYTKQPKWRICWYKGSTSVRCALGFKDWETVFVFGKAYGPAHDHFHIPAPKQKIGHPCPKPIAWAEWFITRFSDAGETILDPFLGSGTTAVAAKKLGRHFLGFEINPEYCQIAEERIAQVEEQSNMAEGLTNSRSDLPGGLCQREAETIPQP